MNPPARERPALTFLGGAGGVTGSKFLLEHGTDQLLLDCGLFQGLKELRLRNWMPPPFDVERLTAVALTHAHIDHSGYLPRLVARGFRGPVYATPATCDLLKILLLDSAHLQEEEARYANKEGYSRHRPALPLYTVEDAERALRLLCPVRSGATVRIGASLELRFTPVGHILGAAAAQVSCDTGWKSVLVDSGDLGRYHRPILRDPEPVRRADWLLVESTYGDRLHAPDPEEELARVIRNTADAGGCLIIPSFAVGRTQELIYAIRKLEEEGRIPILPVHIDSPMAINASEIYCGHPGEHDLDLKLLMDKKTSPFYSRRFFIHRTQEESRAINDLQGPFVLLTSSGMATGGRVLHHLRQRLPDPKTVVLFVGYQAAGTRGQKLQQGAKEIKMFGRLVPVRARIETIDGFSAHADQAEILNWLEGFEEPPRQAYVVHGEPAAAQALARVIRERLRWRVTIPACGDKVVLQ
ncbi:MAG TPA: MBL fold metallo-hydrolase [candidate division Zixibacteria bacterium]|nr:MBL fold metallo-hydrolase [candidate division Zixibacteria bacterium]